MNSNSENNSQNESKTYICPACIVNEKTNGLMCSDCQKEHKRISKSAIREHRPVEIELQYVLRKTEKNLISLIEELEDLKNQTNLYFEKAYQEIREESRGIHFSKEEFIGLVKERCHEIMVKLGLEEQAERIEWLKQTIGLLKNQKRWLEKFNHRETGRRAAEYEKTAV